MEKKDSLDDLDKESAELRRIEEETKKRLNAIRAKRAAIIREQLYGPRRALNLDMPIADDEFLEYLTQREDKFKYELLHEAIDLLREKYGTGSEE